MRNQVGPLKLSLEIKECTGRLVIYSKILYVIYM